MGPVPVHISTGRDLLPVALSGANESPGGDFSSNAMCLFAASRGLPEVCEFSVLGEYAAVRRCHEAGQIEYVWVRQKDL